MSCAGRRTGSTTCSPGSGGPATASPSASTPASAGARSASRGRFEVGNVYVNRNTIGAIVGSQPFGGMGLSGTGPKAGGPNYLARFAHEQVVSTDTTAAGGNASLVTLEDRGGAGRGRMRRRPLRARDAPHRRTALRSCSASIVVVAYVVLPRLWTHYEHEPGLEGRPMVTVTADGIPGDPLNVGLVGTKEEAIRALAAAGWYPADAVTLKTSIEIAGSVHLRPAVSRRAGEPALLRRQEAGLRLREAGRRQRRPAQPCALLARRSAMARRGGRSGSARRPSTAASASATTPAQITHHIGADIDAERNLPDRRSRCGGNADRDLPGDAGSARRSSGGTAAAIPIIPTASSRSAC